MVLGLTPKLVNEMLGSPADGSRVDLLGLQVGPLFVAIFVKRANGHFLFNKGLTVSGPSLSESKTFWFSLGRRHTRLQQGTQERPSGHDILSFEKILILKPVLPSSR